MYNHLEVHKKIKSQKTNEEEQQRRETRNVNFEETDTETGTTATKTPSERSDQHYKSIKMLNEDNGPSEQAFRMLPATIEETQSDEVTSSADNFFEDADLYPKSMNNI